MNIEPLTEQYNSKKFLPTYVQMAARVEIDPVVNGARLIGLDTGTAELRLLSTTTDIFLRRVVKRAVACIYANAYEPTQGEFVCAAGVEFVQTARQALTQFTSTSESTIRRDMAGAASHEVKFELENATDDTTDVTLAIALIVGLRVINEIGAFGA